MPFATSSSCSTARPAPGTARGFTLIEVLITVVIVGVLAAVALPTFFSQVRKSRRAEAITVLSQVTQAQERWRANCASYVTTTASMTAAVSATPCSGGLGIAPTSTYYAYTANAVAASSVAYSATATATGAQLKDTKCLTMTLAASGGQFNYDSAIASNKNLCWNR